MIFTKIKGWFKRKARAKANLVAAFSYNGILYYQFPEYLAMPIDRISRIAEYAKWITRGLDKKQLIELVELADAALFEGLAETKNASKVGFILTEIKDREAKAVPTEIYYNYLAASYIREDEDPLVFNEQTQLDKVMTFKEASKNVDSFFFRLPELIELTKLSNTFSAGWTSILSASEVQSRRQESVLSVLKQVKKSPNKEKP